MLPRLKLLPSTPGRLDLKWALIRRILIATALCVGVGAAIILSNVAAEAWRQNLKAAQTVATYLELQMVRSDRAAGLPQRFPDWSSVTDFSLQQGQCLNFTATDGQVFSRCAGVDTSMPPTPAWFARFYDFVFLRGVDVAAPLLHQGKSRGTIAVTVNRSAVAHQAWLSLSNMMRLSLTLLAIMCGLVYVAVDGALKPTAEILGGLSRLAGGNLSIRLPRYRLRELDHISEGFNQLASRLQVTTAERAEFARRLIDVQEQERRHIARELHDDVAQQLTAIASLAASIKDSSDQAELAAGADELVSHTGRAIRSLRDTLTYLRPPEIDELGLPASLSGLVAEHNRRARQHTHFSLKTAGRLDNLDAETSAHIYRIIQEGLTNAARHADARTVSVSLINRGPVTPTDDSSRDMIDLVIEDDGAGWQEASTVTPDGRFGLLGMRERVSALDGTLTLGTSPTGGALLNVQVRVERAVP